MATIRITIKGDKETVSVMKSLQKEFQDMSTPLNLASKSYMNAISSNFTDEGKTFSKPWKPLSPATVAIKRELRKQGKSVGVEKPLLRTGLLKRSFGFNLIGKKQSNIYNNTDYAIVHQEGGTVLFRGRERKVPKRVLADVDDKRVQMVGSTFETWINGLIQKYKAGQA